MLSRVVPAGFKPLNQHWDSSSRGATVYTLERSVWQQRLIWAHWESPAVTCGGRRSNGRQTALPAADFLADPPVSMATVYSSGEWLLMPSGRRASLCDTAVVYKSLPEGNKRAVCSTTHPPHTVLRRPQDLTAPQRRDAGLRFWFIPTTSLDLKVCLCCFCLYSCSW